MNMARKLFILAEAASIIGTGGLVLNAGVATADASVRPAANNASSISPDFTCPSGVTCFFGNNDYTGTVWEIGNQQYGGGVLHKFSDIGISPNPGSAHINGGSTLWVYNASNGARACVYDGRIPLAHDYGYFWINYGVDTC